MNQLAFKNLGSDTKIEGFRTINIFIPFGKYIGSRAYGDAQSTQYISFHESLFTDFGELSEEKDSFLGLYNKSISQMDKETKDRFEKNLIYSGQKTPFKWTDNSRRLKTKFTKIIENYSSILQEVCRICLIICDQKKSLKEGNLVKEYFSLIKDRYKDNELVLKIIEADSERTRLLKSFRNEINRHAKGSNNREVKFHPFEIDISTKKPTISLFYVEFNDGDSRIEIRGFEYVLNTILSNIFDLSRDLLVIAYARKENIPISLVNGFINGNSIK